MICLLFSLLFIQFSCIMILIESQAEMAGKYSRVFLRVILVIGPIQGHPGAAKSPPLGAGINFGRFLMDFGVPGVNVVSLGMQNCQQKASCVF